MGEEHVRDWRQVLARAAELSVPAREEEAAEPDTMDLESLYLVAGEAGIPREAVDRARTEIAEDAEVVESGGWEPAPAIYRSRLIAAGVNLVGAAGCGTMGWLGIAALAASPSANLGWMFFAIVGTSGCVACVRNVGLVVWDAWRANR